MLKTFRDAWRIPEIRKKILFTLFMLFIYRVGSAIPVPFMDKNAIAVMINNSQNSILGMMDLFAGGNLRQFTIFAANIYPYITASIVLQLLTIAIPSLEALSKEGETGRKQIAKYTRYLTVVLAAITAIGYSFGLFRSMVMTDSLLSKAVIVLSIVAGTMFLVWVGEQITERGIGNGISLLIFTGIVARFPDDIIRSIALVQAGRVHWAYLILFVLVFLLIVVVVVMMNEGERRIPVQYAKRVVGRKMYGGQSPPIPVKVMMSGVMPIIFANSIVGLPLMIAQFRPRSGFAAFVQKWFSYVQMPGLIIYSLVSVILIIFFAFFYTTIQFNTVEYSKNLQQNGGFIPGIRPGRSTSDYLGRVVNRLVLPGAIVLSILAVAPYFLGYASGLQFNFGGTSMIIVVGVILETARVIEQHMLMRHYRGFLK